MNDYIKLGLKITWLVVGSYWLISSIGTKKVKLQEPFFNRFIQYWLPIIIASLLLGPGEWFGHTLLRENFVPHTNLVGIVGLLLCVLGAFIACWSRYILGKNWSLAVQQKVNHELIQNGMYKIIRHPIYTGILLLFIGNTLIVGDYRGIIAVLLIFISFWFKLHKEEKLLNDTFGNQFIAYKNRTKALIPFIL
ncbi:MAG: isoprenylcysteine carboxylmethyltransferase family protein [Bacteroidia bacterium]